jgi:hypothetical protein
MSSLAVGESSVLLVAEPPDASAPLASAVRERGEGRRVARFTLLVPAVAPGLHRVVDPGDQCCAEAEQTICILRQEIEAAAGATIAAMIGSHEPLAAIEDALNLGDFDEIVLAMRPVTWRGDPSRPGQQGQGAGAPGDRRRAPR